MALIHYLRNLKEGMWKEGLVGAVGIEPTAFGLKGRFKQISQECGWPIRYLAGDDRAKVAKDYSFGPCLCVAVHRILAESMVLRYSLLGTSHA